MTKERERRAFISWSKTLYWEHPILGKAGGLGTTTVSYVPWPSMVLLVVLLVKAGLQKIKIQSILCKQKPAWKRDLEHLCVHWAEKK